MPLPFSGVWLSRELLHCTSSLECSLKFPRLYLPISLLKKPLCSDLTPLTLSLRGLSRHTTKQALVFGKSSSPHWITGQGLLCGGSKHLIFKIHHSLLGTWGVRHKVLEAWSSQPPAKQVLCLSIFTHRHELWVNRENLGLNCFSGSGAAWAWPCAVAPQAADTFPVSDGFSVLFIADLSPTCHKSLLHPASQACPGAHLTESCSNLDLGNIHFHSVLAMIWAERRRSHPSFWNLAKVLCQRFFLFRVFPAPVTNKLLCSQAQVLLGS